jgi:hypothetical protein
LLAYARKEVQNARVRTLLVLSLVVTALGCNEAPLLPAPDASTACTAPQVEAPCKAADAGLPGCTPDLNSTALFGQDVIIGAGSYEAGCAVIVNLKGLDSDGQCTQAGSCHCYEDAGSFSWTCYQ